MKLHLSRWRHTGLNSSLRLCP